MDRLEIDPVVDLSDAISGDLLLDKKLGHRLAHRNQTICLSDSCRAAGRDLHDVANVCNRWQTGYLAEPRSNLRRHECVGVDECGVVSGGDCGEGAEGFLESIRAAFDSKGCDFEPGFGEGFRGRTGGGEKKSVGGLLGDFQKGALPSGVGGVFEKIQRAVIHRMDREVWRLPRGVQPAEEREEGGVIGDAKKRSGEGGSSSMR